MRRKLFVQSVVPALFVQSTAYVGPNDTTVMPGAVGWWGLRANQLSYATGSMPAIDIWDSTNTFGPLTVNIKTNGTLNLDAITSWGHGGTGASAPHISKIYDQIGTSHMLQATDALRPTLILPDVAGFGTGLPLISISNTQLMASGFAFPTTAIPFTKSFVAQATAIGCYGLLISGNGNPQAGYRSDAGTAPAMYNGGSILYATAVPTGTSNAMQFVFNGASSIIYVNGTSTPVDDTTGTGSYAGQDIEFQGSGSNYCYFGEFGIWSGNQNSRLSAIDSNQRLYWGFV